MHLRSGYLTSSVGITDGVDCGWVLWTKALTLLVRAMPTKAALACELLGGPPGASWGKTVASAGLGAVVSTRDASNCSSSSERLNSLSVSDAMTAAVAVFHASCRIRTHHRPASGCVILLARWWLVATTRDERLPPVPATAALRASGARARGVLGSAGDDYRCSTPA